MNVDYRTLTQEEIEGERRKQHRKLIFPNIFILLVSLIAAATLLFGSLFSVNVHIDRELVVSLAEMSESGSSSDTDGENTADMLAFLAKDADADIAVSLYPLETVNVAFSDGDGRGALKDLISSAVPDLEKVVETLSNQMAPAMVSYAMMQAVDGLPEGSALEDVDTEVFNDTFRLINEQKPQEAKEEFLSACEIFAANELNMTLTETEKQDLADFFDEALEMMESEDGTFSVSNLLFALMEGGSPTVSDESVQSMSDENVSEGDGSGQSGESGANQFEEVLAMLEDPSAMVDDMDDQTVETIRTVCLAIAVLMLVCAGCWAILALFALIHIFVKNKKVGMWYVKLTGILPFLIFFVLPVVAVAVLPMLSPDLTAVASLPIAFGGMTFVSAICLLVLWCISIFWCHPIKKRIKVCENALRWKRENPENMIGGYQI